MKEWNEAVGDEFDERNILYYSASHLKSITFSRDVEDCVFEAVCNIAGEFIDLVIFKSG
jgi:hypothetical protein